jgi:hypothetical protein
MNMEDRWDATAKSYIFDINAWAREYYLEANQHLIMSIDGGNSSMLLAGMRIEITEMNICGSIELNALLTGNFSRLGGDNKTNSTTEFTKWKVPESEDPENKLTKPVDFIQEVEIPRIPSNPPSEDDKKPLREKNYKITLEP